MNQKIAIICLAVVGLLALAVGCGKTENAAPPAKEADKPISAPKEEPRPKTEQPGTQISNAAATTTDAAKTTLDTGVKAADAAMTPVTEAVPKVMATTSPAPDKPQDVLGQAQTTVSGLSQDQVVQGLPIRLSHLCAVAPKANNRL
jgi:hypothetical protein